MFLPPFAGGFRPLNNHSTSQKEQQRDISGFYGLCDQEMQ
jgi:hypothetical protein